MTHKLTRRERATIAALFKIERDEYSYLVKLQNQGAELSTADENVKRAYQVQINRWSASYKCLHTAEDVITADGREVYC